MEIGYLNEVKAILKSLVLSHPDKITIDKLNRDYRDVEGQDIPFRRLGYRHLEQFLRQIPDTLLVCGSGHSAVVYFVGNEKSAHIHNMIMSQKKSKPKSKTKGRYGNGIGFSPHPHTPPTDRGRNNNRFTDASQPRQMQGQRLSAFDVTNRNVSTRTVTVRDIPRHNRNAGGFSSSTNHASIFDALPQPNGIKCYSSQNTNRAATNTERQHTATAQNNIKCLTTTNDKKSSPEVIQKYQEHVKQLESLMATSCYVTPPAIKTVSFSADTQTQVKMPKEITRAATNALVGVNQPKPKVKLSDNVERLIRVSTQNVKKQNPLAVEMVDVVETGAEATTKEATDVNSDKCDVNECNKLFDISDIQVNDIDEAVPEFAANHRVFQFDFPKHTVQYGHKFVPYKIPDAIEVGTLLGVFIAEIHNPFRFWFHIHKDEHELDKLMFQMERYYSTINSAELSLPMACLKPGQICAASYNDMWHRGEIRTLPVNNKVKVFFVDYGTVCEVDISDIKYLGSCFSQLPIQGLRGCLSHIKPRGLHWSHEATSYFLTSVSELMLYAKITEIDRENLIFYMILCDTHGEEVVQINKTLVENNYALYNEEWQELKIKKKNDRRVRHPREDFPTFSMIESGEYPSFAELVQLQQRNIDYETIYDRIIFNKYAILNMHDNVPESIRKLPFFLMTTNPFRSDIVFELTGMKTSTC